MLPLTPEQEQIFNRVATKAQSMGLTRAGQRDWYWAHSYQLNNNDSVTLGCSCDPNIKNSPVSILLMAPLPSTGKYAKYESKFYSIEEFENLNGEDLVSFSNYVQNKNNEIADLEEKLQSLRKDVTTHVKKTIKKKF